MKKKTLLILVFMMFVSVLMVQAQRKNSGSGFAYQAVLRDINGSVLNQKSVTLKFSLYDNSSAGQPEWSQTKTLTTDKFGVVKTVVGKLNDEKTVAEKFSEVNFNSTQYWFKVELEKGENKFDEISFAQLPSAPYSESAFSVSFAVPVGTIVAFAGKIAPDGWLLCDGTDYDSNTYSDLNDLLANDWGKRETTGRFNVPDLRGTFLRGLDTRTIGKVDPEANRKLGSLQTAATDVRNFKGSFSIATPNVNIAENASESFTMHAIDHGGFRIGKSDSGAITTKQQNITLNPPVEYTTETRPVNHAVNYIIKY